MKMYKGIFSLTLITAPIAEIYIAEEGQQQQQNSRNVEATRDTLQNTFSTANISLFVFLLRPYNVHNNLYLCCSVFVWSDGFGWFLLLLVVCCWHACFSGVSFLSLFYPQKIIYNITTHYRQHSGNKQCV